MRCPGCEFVSSDLRDICPRCYIDLRPHKKILGLKVTNSKSTYDELLSKQLPPGTKPRKSKNKQDVKPRPQQSVASAASVPSPTPIPAPTQPPSQPAPRPQPSKQRGPSFASTVFTKFKNILQRPAPALPSETLSKDVSPALIEPNKPDTLEPVVAITQPEWRTETRVEARVEPEIDASLAKFYNEPLLPPTPPPAPPVLDLSETQEDFSGLLDSIIDQSEVTIESIEGKADSAKESTSDVGDHETAFEYELSEEELEEPTDDDFIEPPNVAAPEVEPAPIEQPTPEPLISLPLLPSSSPPTVLPEAQEDVQSHIEPIVEQEAAFEVEPAMEPVEAYLPVAKVFEPLYPESKPLQFQSRAPEHAFSEIVMTENVAPPPDILVASLSEQQEISLPEVVSETQLEDQQQTNGHGSDQHTQPQLMDYEPPASAQAALNSSMTFDLSPQQIADTNQIFDLLQAQPWQDNQAIELSADSLGLTTDRETLELLFDLSLESLTNPEVEHILEKDIARSESRHLANEGLEKQLKRVEQELSKSVVSLKGVAGSRSNIPDQPTSKEFDFSPVAPTLRQRAISILLDLALVACVSAVFSIVRAISTEIALPSTESVYDFAIDAAPIFSSFIVMCLALLPIYTIAAFFTLGNTAGGIVGKIDIRTSTGKIPKPANLILRGLALPISLFLPAMRLQDRVSRTLACRGAEE